MNKIICDVCGTAYPETAAQCPICGCAKPENPRIASAQAGEDQEAYAYVKGGRFSKSNVRKRNNLAKPAPVYAEEEPEEDEEPVESNRGLTIAIIVLLLAIIAVAAYIYIRFFLPGDSGENLPQDTSPSIVETTPEATPEATPEPTPEGTQDEITTPPETTPEATAVPPETTPANIACTSIKLTDANLSFSQIGSTWQLTAKAEPAGTTDVITYSSSDVKVATVDASGKVTAVGDGTATITVTCGGKTAKCEVTVVKPTEAKTYKLNVVNGDCTLKVGEGWPLRLRDEDKNEVEGATWKTSNAGICTVNSKGYIKAIAPGTAVITCTYEGVTYKCTVHVKG